jgi:transcriptional regulator with XRE-family HTH domain
VILQSNGGMRTNAAISNGDLLARTPTPRDWLGRRLAELGKSQRSLALEIGYDPSQVNKWLSGKERIPDKALLQAGACLGGGNFEAARSILAINTLVEALPNDARKATQSDTQAGLVVAQALARKAEDTAGQLSSDEQDRMGYLQNHLSTAIDILVMTSQCNSERADLIREDNVRKHLCFPFNVMMGELMRVARVGNSSLGEVDLQLMKSIRKTAKRAGTRLAEAYCQQHAYHLLGRYGARADQEFMNELIANRDDAVTRRTAHYGAIFAAQSALAAERFIFELRRDAELKQSNLDFDFVHYGDKELEEKRPKSVGRTISNNLRHVLGHPGAATTEVAFLKLITMLLDFGVPQFESKRTREKIEVVLRTIQDTDATRRTAMESEFLTHFGRLSAFRPPNGVQLVLPGIE